MSLLSNLFKSEKSNDTDGDNPKSDKLQRIGNKNIKVITKTLLKDGKQARMVELSAISNMWVSTMSRDAKDNVHKVDNNWGVNHGLGSDAMYVVSFSRLQTSKDGLAPVLVSKKNKAMIYGEYELIDLFNWTESTNTNKVLFKIKTKLLSNTRNITKDNVEILGHTVCKDDIGYYIIRNMPNFSDIKHVTYFLPNTENVNLVI